MSVQDLRMLFVDDNPNWLNSVVAGLTSQKVEERGWKIDRAYTVEEALEKLAAGPYALLLCDLDFFGEPRGLAVLRAALEDPKAPTYQPDICAIVLTAVGEFGALLKAYELGAFHFVSKDFGTGKDLLQAIIHLIEKGLEWRRGRVEENEFHKCFQQCAATRNEKTDAKAVATEVVKSLGRILGDPWSIQVATFVQNRWEVLTKTEEGPKLPSESIAGLIKDKRALLDKVSWSAYPIEVDKGNPAAVLVGASDGRISKLQERRIQSLAHVVSLAVEFQARYQEELLYREELLLNQTFRANLKGSLAHKFSNLLQVASGWASNLKDQLVRKQPHDELQEPLEKVLDSLRVMEEDLTGFFTYFDDAPWEKREVRVNDLLDQARDRLRHPRDARVTVEPCDEALKTYGDPEALWLVLDTLLQNACDALPEDDESKVVILRASGSKDDDRVILRIEDQGRGIPRELRDKIFEPFYSTKPKESGRKHGLGLYFARELVERVHGGSLVLKHSEPGQGSVFHVELPATVEA